MNRTLGALTLASVTALLLGGLAPATADDLDDDLDSVAGRIAALSAQISDATAQRRYDWKLWIGGMKKAAYPFV